MATKSEILNNLREYSSDQIAEAIQSGVVTIYELSKSGNLTPLMRKRIEQKLANSSNTIIEKEKEILTQTDSINTPVSDDNKEDLEIPPAIEEEIPDEINIPKATIPSATAEPTLSSPQENIVEPTNATQSKGTFNHPFSFNGRIRRLEYGLSMIIYFVWYVIMQAMMATPDPAPAAGIFVLISFIPMVWFLWAQNCKRCHDRGNSGWYQLIPFYFFVLLFGDGDEGTNEYGDNPKK